MKKLFLYLAAILSLTQVQAQLTDTLTHRQPHYYYSQWYDTCQFGYNLDVYPHFSLCLAKCGGLGQYAQAYSDYTPSPLQVQGVAVMVKYVDVSERLCPWRDTNYAPEYIFLAYWDSTTGTMQKLDSARWDTLEPKTMRWDLCGTPDLYPGGAQQATQYCRVYEAYFEKPVTVDSVFWLVGTTNSNFFEETPPGIEHLYLTNREVYYMRAWDQGAGTICAPLNPLQQHKILHSRVNETWYTPADYTIPHPCWGPFIPIVVVQWLLEVESADSTMGRVQGGNGYYPDSMRVRIEAVPEPGYLFTHWSDGDSTNPRQVLLVGDTHLTAHFREAEYYHIAAEAFPAEAGTVSGGGMQPEQTDITLEALPSAHYYHFVRWSDSVRENPRVVRIHSDTSFVAVFGIDSSAFEGIGTPEATAAGFTLTPNPARESVTVTLDGRGVPATITVYDATGHPVLHRRATGRRTRLSTAGLPAGTYFVTVTTPQGTGTQKLTVLQR